MSLLSLFICRTFFKVRKFIICISSIAESIGLNDWASPQKSGEDLCTLTALFLCPSYAQCAGGTGPLPPSAPDSPLLPLIGSSWLVVLLGKGKS